MVVGVLPLRKGETTEVVRMAAEAAVEASESISSTVRGPRYRGEGWRRAPKIYSSGRASGGL